MNELFLQDFMTLDSGTPGVLRLQNGVLSFSDLNETITFTINDQTTIAASTETLRIDRGNETYLFTRGVENPDQVRSLLVMPANESTQMTRAAIISSQNLNNADLVSTYDEEKISNELWVMILTAAGFNASYQKGVIDRTGLTKRSLVVIAIAATIVVITFAIMLRIAIS